MNIQKDRLISLVLTHSRLIILTTILLVLVCLVFIPKIRIDNSVDVFFDKNSASYIDFQEWKEEFGSDQIVILTLTDKTIFTPANLALIGNAVNTTNKFTGKTVIDIATGIIYVATGGAAADVWKGSNASTVTPI